LINLELTIIRQTNRFLPISIALVLVACSNHTGAEQKAHTTLPESTTIVSPDYKLIIPKKQEGLLILFPCFPCNAENTSTEFDIVDIAIANNITVLLMNFNQHLWLLETEKNELEKTITAAIIQNSIDTHNTYIGGFSSGGNVSLLFTDHLISIGSIIQPKGVFIVDAPIDLMALYETAHKTIKRNFSEVAVQEANWIVETFDSEFGAGDTALINYHKKSPYLSSTNATHNLSNLSGVKIRLYSEPDTLWWKVNR
jgi:hypothetical protein